MCGGREGEQKYFIRFVKLIRFCSYGVRRLEKELGTTCCSKILIVMVSSFFFVYPSTCHLKRTPE